jgi:O-antigen ligase
MKSHFTLNNIDEYLLYLMVFFLPLSMGIPNILLGLCVFIFIIKTFNRQQFVTNKPLKTIIVLVMYLILNFTLKGELFSNISMLGRLLIIPSFLVLLLQGNMENILKTFRLSYAVLTIFVFFKIIIYYINYGDLNFSTVKEFHTLLFIDRPYFGFVSLLGLILNIKYLQEYGKQKYLIYFLSLTSILLIYIVAARLTMLTIFILCFVFVFKKIQINVFKKVLILLSLSLLFVTSLALNKNFINRLVINQGVASFIDYEPRFVIWPCATKLITEEAINSAVGSGGFTKTQQQLCDCYEKNIDNDSKKEWYLERKFNTHNQFLGFLLVGGIIGLIIFIYLLYQLFQTSYKNTYMFSIWISFVLFLTLENIFYRQYGCYLIAVIVLFLTQEKNEKSKNSSHS